MTVALQDVLCLKALRTNTSKYKFLQYWMIEEPVGGVAVKVLIALPAFNY